MQLFQRIVSILFVAALVVGVTTALSPARTTTTAQANDNVVETASETIPYSKGDLAMHQSVTRPIQEALVDQAVKLAKTYHIEEGDSQGEKDPAPENPTDELRASLEALFPEQIRDMMAQTIYGEANYDWLTPAQKSMVIWAILNRWDSGETWFGHDLYEIITKDDQFKGYDPSNPVTEEYRDLVDDIIVRYINEKLGATDVGRTLPSDICFFHADDAGRQNVFYKMSIPWLSGEKIYFGTEPLCDPYSENA